MIARIQFTLNGEPAEATLGDDGKWSCPDDVLRQALDLLTDAADRSPSLGRPLRGFAGQLATTLGGTAEYGPAPEAAPGRVY